MIHRHLMHKNVLAKFLHIAYLASTFRDHAIIHHARCYAVFDKERKACSAINIRVKPITSTLVIAPLCCLLLLLDPITSLVFFLTAIVSGMLWSEIHDEMHRPRGAWFSNFHAYRYLKRRHYLHHRHPNTNFNTLLPMWDWVLRTASIETEADRLEMRSLAWHVRRSANDEVSRRI
jgi:hypothetical protein